MKTKYAIEYLKKKDLDKLNSFVRFNQTHYIENSQLNSILENHLKTIFFDLSISDFTSENDIKKYLAIEYKALEELKNKISKVYNGE